VAAGAAAVACLGVLLAGCHRRHVIGEIRPVVPGADAQSPSDAAADARPDAPPPSDAPPPREDAPVADAAPSPGDARGRDLPPALATCGAFAPGLDFQPCAASYLSGTAAEAHAAIVVAPSGALAVATHLESVELAGPGGVTSLLGGGPAAVVRLTSDGRQVLSVTKIGSSITDLDVDGRGRLALVGAPFGLAVLTPDASDLVWSRPTTGARVAVGSDGVIAVLDSMKGEVALFDMDGAARPTIKVATEGGTAVDVAVHGGSRLVIVTGSQAAGTTRQPFLNAHAYGGEVRWRNYGWKESDIGPRRLTASSRGTRVAIGGDDRVYFVGDSHGGNTSFAKSPRNLDQPAELAISDEFNFPYGTATQVLFIARFRADGRMELGQHLLSRDPPDRSGDGQPTIAGSIAADERGQVLVGGRGACCVENADGKKIRGIDLAYGDDDAFVLVISPDFRTRHLWTTFGRGTAETVGVAATRGVMAAIAIHGNAARAPLPVHEAVQPRPGGGASDVYLTVWPAP
jgi:hypothetical protein